MYVHVHVYTVHMSHILRVLSETVHVIKLSLGTFVYLYYYMYTYVVCMCNVILPNYYEIYKSKKSKKWKGSLLLLL